MASLQILRNKKEIAVLQLQPDKEWFFGRASSSDFVMQGEPGISRQHFKIARANGGWELEVLSKYGELYCEGKKVQTLQLSDGTRFEVQPFEFVFQEGQSQSVGKVLASKELVPSDRTYVGSLNIHPFLKVIDHQGQVVQIFRMEGHSWVAGRDIICPLFIDNQKFSRRHFEIRLEDGAYLIKDLGSSNGTLLNGEALSTSKWSVLKSGDVLTVVDWALHFELRDAFFEDKLQEISPDLLEQNDFAHDLSPEVLQPPPGPQAQSKQSPSSENSRRKKNVNWVRMAIYVLLVGGGVAYLTSGQEKSEAPQGKPTLNAFEKLTAQQQHYVKETYRLADRLFKEGRYEMARQEVAKIHQLIPEYEESRNLEKLADVAVQNLIEQQKAEARERESIEMEEKIQRTVSQCQKLVGPQVEMKEIDDCLASVIPLNPEHAAIVSMKASVDQIINERIERSEKMAEFRALARRQNSLYDKAQRLQSAGKPLEAIEALELVVASKLPDPDDTKGKARRDIAAIQKNLMSQQETLQSAADEAVKKGDLKTAITTLQKAMLINPQNETLKGRVNTLISELRKQMQTLYQEGVLEESVGEVETAKTKWKKILETSVPDEDYYKKAKTKLKKYEAF